MTLQTRWVDDARLRSGITFEGISADVIPSSKPLSFCHYISVFPLLGIVKMSLALHVFQASLPESGPKCFSLNLLVYNVFQISRSGGSLNWARGQDNTGESRQGAISPPRGQQTQPGSHCPGKLPGSPILTKNFLAASAHLHPTVMSDEKNDM